MVYGLTDRIEFLTQHEAKINLKDHKIDFQDNCVTRPICPSQCDIVRLSKSIVDTTLSRIIQNLSFKL